MKRANFVQHQLSRMENSLGKWDYVSDWDMEGVNFDKLFDVHRTLVESRMYEQVYQGA